MAPQRCLGEERALLVPCQTPQLGMLSMISQSYWHTGCSMAALWAVYQELIARNVEAESILRYVDLVRSTTIHRKK